MVPLSRIGAQKHPIWDSKGVAARGAWISSPEVYPMRGGAWSHRWSRFHRETIDQTMGSPMVVLLCRFGAWKIVFWSVRACGGSNGDDFSGFCRSSDDLSIGIGGCSMGRVEVGDPRLSVLGGFWMLRK